MLTTNAICAEIANYAIDGAAILCILILSIIAARRGLIGCLFGFLSTIASLVLAFLLAPLLVNATGGLFGVEEALGTLAAKLICWVAVFFICKLLLRFVRKLLTAIIDKIPLVGSLNHILGFAVGVLQGLLALSGILAVAALLPLAQITEFIDGTILVKAFYYHNPIPVILTWLV